MKMKSGVKSRKAFRFEFQSYRMAAIGGGDEVAKEFSAAIYNSQRWRKVAKAYAESQHHICERCHNRSFIGTGKEPRFIVHHKRHLTPDNVHDDYIVYGWNNLELLCIYCHNAVHGTGLDRECLFDDDGNPVGIIDHSR